MKEKISLQSEFNETSDGEYHYCGTCGAKTVLVCALAEWSVDQEPYKSGEEGRDLDDPPPEYVEVHAEVTGHFCLECRHLTTICVHT